MSDGYEDCFVIAKNSRSARHVDVEMNGFNYSDTSAFMISSIPDDLEKVANRKFLNWSKKNAPNQVNKDLKAWPDYAPNWVLDKIGALRRTVNGERQVLINDYVFCYDEKGQARYYSIGNREINRIVNKYAILDDEIESWTPKQFALFGGLGESLALCHEIEWYISRAFVLALSDKEKTKYRTINDLTEAWSKKTFGQLFKIIKETYKVEPTIEAGLEAFLQMRNKIVHGICTDPQYDLWDEWGQKELISFLFFFTYVARSVRMVFRYCYIVSSLYAEDVLLNKRKGRELSEEELDAVDFYRSSFEFHK